MGHTFGCKSFPKRRHEEALKRGAPPSRGQLFIMTHIRKDGKPVDDASDVAMGQMREKISQLLEGSDDPVAKDDVYAQVMGPERRGRVRGLGFGVSPSDIWGKQSTPNPSTEANSEMETLRQKNAELEEKYAELHHHHVELQQRHTELQQQHVTLGQRVDNLNAEINTLRSCFRRVRDRYEWRDMINRMMVYME